MASVWLKRVVGNLGWVKDTAPVPIPNSKIGQRALWIAPHLAMWVKIGTSVRP